MEFISVVPIMVQGRVMALWSRLVESGINGHVERKTTNLYKAARSDWFWRQQIPAKSSTHDERNDSTSSWLEMILLLLVLCIGHSTAALVFGIELVWTRNWRFGTNF